MPPNPQSTAYEELVKKIIEAVPEIMEVRFGCLLKPRGGECGFIVLAQTKDHVQVLNTFAMEYEHIGPDGNPIQWVWKSKGANKEIVTFAERFEVLGRPITLEDVLRALIASVDQKFHPHSPVQRNRAYQQYTLQILGKWHLGHSLEWHRDNAPETITFLHSLLC